MTAAIETKGDETGKLAEQMSKKLLKKLENELLIKLVSLQNSTNTSL